MFYDSTSVSAALDLALIMVIVLVTLQLVSVISAIKEIRKNDFSLMMWYFAVTVFNGISIERAKN